VTTRGFGVDEMKTIGRWIAEIVQTPDDEEQIARIREQAEAMSAAFPLPGVTDRDLQT
jgi:glycine hydroxymethyltransferase